MKRFSSSEKCKVRRFSKRLPLAADEDWCITEDQTVSASLPNWGTFEQEFDEFKRIEF